MNVAKKPVARSHLLLLLLICGACCGCSSGFEDATVAITVGNPNPATVSAGQMSTTPIDASILLPSGVDLTKLAGSQVWSWSATGATGLRIEHPSPNAPQATLKAQIAAPGVPQVTLTATLVLTDSDGRTIRRTATSTLPITVAAEPAALQYFQRDAAGGGKYVDVTGPIYVLQGEYVEFKAIPPPGRSGFSHGAPEWSGAAGAKGSGATINVTGETLSKTSYDTQTVTATCDDRSVTANIIVYELIPEVVPEDNFEGRALDAWGIFEIILLSCRTNPPGIPIVDLGGVQWKITQGGGTVIAGADGFGTYEVPGEGGSVMIGVEVIDGPMKGIERPPVIVGAEPVDAKEPG
ncbi:MAG TPA: hypothetical protein VGJ26_01840 [Pirellulales bacterium]|jgi:hypothetical protein